MTEKQMKALEAEWTLTLPAHGYKILRLDGRGFSRWTKKHCEKPFDPHFSDCMNWAAKELCKEIQGAQFAYVQSDEISVLITDLGEKAQQWFGGDVSKTCSVSASIATSEFNGMFHFADSSHENDSAQFDARVFALPDRLSVERYFLWRQADAYRNAVSMLASHHFSAKKLHGRNVYDRLIMLNDKGIFVQGMDQGDFNGRLVLPTSVTETVTFAHKKTGEEKTATVVRSHWKIEKAEWFGWDQSAPLNILIP